MRTLILYSSTNGQTHAICQRIKNHLEENEQLVDMADILTFNEAVDAFDVVIIGARVRYGKHHKKVIDFVKRHHAILQNKKTAFFSVNLVARDKRKAIPDNNNYVKKFLSDTDWEPDVKAVFAGKLNYPEYGFLDKTMIRFIMFLTKGPTDTKQAYDFTSWDDVNNFSQRICILCKNSES